MAAEVAELGEALVGSRPQADVAVLHDYDSRFALQVQPTNAALGYEETVQRHYEAFRRLGLGVDVVSPAVDLSAYRIVVAPSLYVLDEVVAQALGGYAESGGTLVLGPRSSIKDRGNAIPERPVPAWLDTLAGLEVVDYASLAETKTARISGAGGHGIGGGLHGWFEELELRDATPLAVYEDGPFAGAAAVASRHAGRGRVVYLGGSADVATLVDLYRAIAVDAGLGVLEVPEGVEVVPLVGESGRSLFLLNHSDEERVVELAPGDWHDRVAGAAADSRIALAPVGIGLVEERAGAGTEEQREVVERAGA